MQLAILLEIFSDDLTNTQVGCHLGVTPASITSETDDLFRWVRKLWSDSEVGEVRRLSEKVSELIRF